MVAPTAIRASNAQICTTLPSPLVGVFAGATSGIGEYTLRAFVKHTKSSRAYIIGRTQADADKIIADCKVVNPDAEVIFIKADLSLLKNVDEVCKQIAGREKYVNVLCMSTMSVAFGTKTTEGLHKALALATHSRYRLALNLLPLIRTAPSLRRVLSVLTGTKEGPIDLTDLEGLSMPVTQIRSHAASVTTLVFEELARRAPEVSFIHEYPGTVKSKLGKDANSLGIKVFLTLFQTLAPFFAIPDEESGERHLFCLTSGRFPPREGEGAAGVAVDGSVGVARGTDGVVGSGVYSVDENGEVADAKVEALLAGYRKDGTAAKVWEHHAADFKRVTGSEVLQL
ncbi:hypothetical protein HDV00_008801 [Rhizophlyctis rosea]|nr:hypothetical protein HDV00_008801 [Rhizophlyctis rosea]